MLPPACGVHWRERERAGVTVGLHRLLLPTGSNVGMSLFSLFRDGESHQILAGTLDRRNLGWGRACIRQKDVHAIPDRPEKLRWRSCS
ncbi:hypothetical protein F5Y08DRAFT_318348, partial [Xylaria arbuscula]